jgi:antitoxin ChpS
LLTNYRYCPNRNPPIITVNIRKQGNTAVITIPSDVLKRLNVDVGATLELELGEGAFMARPVRSGEPNRYSLAELLRGTTPENLVSLNEETAWAREGEPVRRDWDEVATHSAAGQRHTTGKPKYPPTPNLLPPAPPPPASATAA